MNFICFSCNDFGGDLKNAQDPEAIVLGTSGVPVEVLAEAIARCGDAMYGRVPEMDLPLRVRGMVQNVLGECDALEVVTEVWEAAAFTQLGSLIGREQASTASHGGAFWPVPTPIDAMLRSAVLCTLCYALGRRGAGSRRGRRRRTRARGRS